MPTMLTVSPNNDSRSPRPAQERISKVHRMSISFYLFCALAVFTALEILVIANSQQNSHRCYLPFSSSDSTVRGAASKYHDKSKNPAEAPTIATTTTLTADPLQDFQICRPSDWDSYVCKGPEYEQFADKLIGMLLFLEHRRRFPGASAAVTWPLEAPKSHLWGKRQGSPFPAKSTILALGNSHTRQILQALPCQYSIKQIVDMEASKSDNVMRRGSYYFVEFENQAKLHLVTNHALFYSHQWPRYLQELVNHTTLEDFDALIVGKMNTFDEAYNTSFMEIMMEKTAKYEQADFTTNPPPSLLDLAEIYKGPIVAHSMFCDWGGEYLYWDMYEQVEKLKEQDYPVRLVNGRQYIPWLGECATNNWQSIGVCGDDETAHRCIGARGGHPDLVAWDVVEAVHELVLLQESSPF